MKWIAWLCAAIVAGSAPAGAEIIIGVAGPLSGQYSALGNQLRIGVEAAVTDANASGGINGEILSVMPLDDACDTRKAVAAARQFVTQDVRLVVGHFCSGAAAAAALVYKEAGILMIAPSATLPALTEAGNWNTFRMTGRDDGPYALAARRISSSQGAPKAAIVSTTTPQSQSLAQSVTAVLPAALQLSVKLGAFNSTATAQQLVSNGVQSVIVMLPSNEAAELAASLLYAGFQGEIYGGDQFLNEAFASGVGEVGYTMLAAFPEDPMANAAATSVVHRFLLKGETPEGATLPAYAAVQAFVAAAKARSVNDGPAMADWLRSGNGVDTVLGKVTFDAKGDLARQPFAWYRWLGADKRFVPE